MFPIYGCRTKTALCFNQDICNYTSKGRKLNHDKLFDKGYITFDDDGKIIISDRLTENDRVFLNVNSRMHIELTESNKKYLKFHRENVFDR